MRNPDKRLRLVRVDRGTWKDEPRPANMSAKYHGSWKTRDGRFLLRWEVAISRPNRAHPRGGLYVWDFTRWYGKHFATMREALEWIARVYDREGYQGPRDRRRKYARGPAACPRCGGTEIKHVSRSRAHVCRNIRCGERWRADCAPYRHGGSLK